MKNSSELKQDARQSLTNNWGQGIAVSAIYSAISTAGSYAIGAIVGILSVIITIPLTAILLNSMSSEIATATTEFVASIFNLLASLVALLVTAPLAYGLTTCFIKLVRTSQINIADIFLGFTKAFQKSFVMQLLVTIYTTLWTLLFIIPGIIKGISYAMSYFVLIDNPEFTANQAIAESQRLMNGHKADYFMLQLSFIGWILLSIFTCGIGFIFLVPYMESANAHFYQSIKAEKALEENPITFGN